MGIQYKQVDKLQGTFDSLSGDLQGQLTTLSGSNSEIASGSFVFAGNKYFTGNADFSGAQGIFVDPNNIYTPNNIFAGGIKIGGTIATPRTSTSAPAGSFQVTGGQSYFDAQVNIRNSAGINITDGSITGGSGEFSQVKSTLISGANFSGESGYYNEVKITGVTGFLKLHAIPDYTETGNIPAPATGTVFRSGNYLMIV